MENAVFKKKLRLYVVVAYSDCTFPHRLGMNKYPLFGKILPHKHTPNPISIIKNNQ